MNVVFDDARYQSSVFMTLVIYRVKGNDRNVSMHAHIHLKRPARLRHRRHRNAETRSAERRPKAREHFRAALRVLERPPVP
jgi:hypothetical protein